MTRSRDTVHDPEVTMSSQRPILIDIPERLEGPRVLVRPWRRGDGLALWSAIEESRAHLAPWMPWLDDTNNPDHSEEYVIRSGARWDLREDLAVGIFERESGRLLGASGLHRIDWKIRRFEVGYWLRATAEGHGYMLEATQLLTRLAFEVLEAGRVEIRMDTANERSRRVAERLGYILEATLPRAYAGPGNVAKDIYLFRLLPEEYVALPWLTGATPAARTSAPPASAPPANRPSESAPPGPSAPADRTGSD
jgi:ribosomal-protein-serine acetyltransferase